MSRVTLVVSIQSLTLESIKPDARAIAMKDTCFLVFKHLFAGMLFGIAAWLFMEEIRMPPALSRLHRVSGKIDSVTVEPVRMAKGGYQTGTRLVVRLQESSRDFIFLDKQPGFGVAAGLQRGDQIEMHCDPWWVPHPSSLVIYAFSVNGEEIATYEQTVSTQFRGGYAFTAVLFVLLGLGAMAATEWGRRRLERSDRPS